MQSRTSAFAAQADASHNEPVVLVRIYLTGLTLRYSTRAGSYGGQVYEERIAESITLSAGMDRFGRVERTTGRLVLQNGDDITGTRISDLLATYTFDNAACEIDQAFVGLPEADWLPLFRGIVVLPEEGAFDARTFTMDLYDEGQPAQPEMIALRANRIHRIIGERITATAYPGADPDVIGSILPELFGALTGARALPTDAGMVDALAADITAVATSLQLSDATRFALYPATGTVQIEDEQMTYTGKTPATLTLTGLGRHAGGTTAAAHVKGRDVWEIQASYIYTVARHACQGVTNVKVDGVLQTTGYSTDLTGPTTITFTSKPRRDLAVAVTTQPVHTSTVTAEQTPGAVTTTAEQSPGAVTTTAEHGHSTDTGSHDHDEDESVHEYPTAPSLPATLTADTTVTFANSPKAGTSVNWHAYVAAISGTWVLRDVHGAGIHTFTGAAGDHYWTEAGAGGHTAYTLDLDGSGLIALDLLERDITKLVSTTADAAAGVSTSKTGATATSMASLAGATATSMASLSGSTAVSTSRTTNVVVSAADVEVGEVVTCDVESWVDDGSGTYTGTPGALITNPADQIALLLGHADYLGLALADYRDAATFAAARAAFAATGIRADWGLYEATDSAELLERLRWSVAARLFQDNAGAFKCYVLPLGGTSVLAIDEATDVVRREDGGGPIRIGRTNLRDLVNHVWVRYAREVASGAYRGLAETEDAASETMYRTENGLAIENDFLRDATAAAAVAAKYLAHHKDPAWRAVAVVRGLPAAHIEPCDPADITCTRGPGGWTAEPMIVDKVSRTVGKTYRAELACVEA